MAAMRAGAGELGAALGLLESAAPKDDTNVK